MVKQSWLPSSERNSLAQKKLASLNYRQSIKYYILYISPTDV